MNSHLKYFLLIIIIIFIFGCKPESENDLSLNGLSGSVKSYKEQSFVVKNEFGKIGKGKPIRFYDEYEESISNKIIHFNEDGYITRKSFFNELGELKKVIKNELDGENRIINQLEFDPKGSLVDKKAYSYKGKLKLVESITSYRRNGKVRDAMNIVYDEDFNEIERYIRFPDGNINQKWIVTYKNDGLTKYIAEYREGVEYYKNIFYYNKSYDLIKKKNYYQLDGQFIWHYTYNKYQNIAECRKSNHDNSNLETTVYKYSYNGEKNWINKTVYINEIPVYIVERDYSYY